MVVNNTLYSSQTTQSTQVSSQHNSVLSLNTIVSNVYWKLVKKRRQRRRSTWLLWTCTNSDLCFMKKLSVVHERRPSNLEEPKRFDKEEWTEYFKSFVCLNVQFPIKLVIQTPVVKYLHFKKKKKQKLYVHNVFNQRQIGIYMYIYIKHEAFLSTPVASV